MSNASVKDFVRQRFNVDERLFLTRFPNFFEFVTNLFRARFIFTRA